MHGIDPRSLLGTTGASALAASSRMHRPRVFAGSSIADISIIHEQSRSPLSCHAFIY